tara:strand:+ start:914 stop:1990 length:1077 start_codon:yes stop_codon:yes gene_type:complete
MRKLIALLLATSLLVGCSSAGETVELEQPSTVQRTQADGAQSPEPEMYEVAGFTSINEEWAYKFAPPQDCDETSGACITLSLQTLSPCERAEISYRLESIHREFKFLQKHIELSVKSNFSSGTELLSWKDPTWERVQLKSIQCIRPKNGAMALTTGNLAPVLTVNAGFPESYWPLNMRLAFQWKDSAPCKDFYDTCWSMYVFSATSCAAAYASFEIQDEVGKVLDTQILATRNVAIPARTPTAVQFGTSSKIDSGQRENLRIHVKSIDCLDTPIENESAYAASVSQVDLPIEFCYLGVCNPVAETATESDLSRILEYLQQYPTNSSGGTGYRVRCNDGTYSNAGGRQGACSWHGGVSG